jgi:protein-L-isoaspartate(D-aspartate) O-methyltransferase
VVDREEPLSDLNLWLACTLDQYCVLMADRSAVKKRLVAPTPRWGTSATIADDTLTYLTSRPTKHKHLIELGAIAHGPAAGQAEQMVEQTQTFNTHYRHGPGPILTIYPAAAPDESEGPTGGVQLRLDRPHTRLVVSWP